MRATTVLLCLFILFCGCRKNDQQPVSQKGLRGKVIYCSCATTAVQVLNNENIGSDWTNCHDQQTYHHVIDVAIPELNTAPIQGEFNFEIIAGEPHAKCYMADCGPSKSYTIAIIKD